MSQVWAYLSVAALMFTGLLLIFIILLQRGRGGGLAGAFGGAGGQSALGTKAGDVFTKITVALAVFWVLLACLSIYALRAGTEFQFGTESTSPSVTSEGDQGDSPIPPDATPEVEPALPGATTPDTPGADSGSDDVSSPGPALTPPGDEPAETDDAASGAENAAAPATP